MLSIWRYSHVTLAFSSALFIALASLTGIVLALEPISNHFKTAKISNLESITVAETIEKLQQNYTEVISISVEENNFVKANVITKKDKSASFFINPKTGEKVAALKKRHPIFEFTTNFHRSLFLKSTGRILVGFFTFLFVLLAIAGFCLILKRQGGFKKLFTKTVKENTAQFYHVVFSKYAFVPVVIIASTGVYLSLEKFGFIPKTNEKTIFVENEKQSTMAKHTDFAIFKTTTLDDVKQLDFPFSPDEEEYFYLKLKDKELAIQQFTGAVVSIKNLGINTLLTDYSLSLHTGRGTFLWALVLLITSGVTCYFIYSGFVIYVKRKKQKKVLQNRFTKDNADFIVLIGSETGSTQRFANAFYEALLQVDKKVFIDVLNNYSTYEKAKNIIVFTATYGDGEAPANASKFLKRSTEIYPINTIKYSVVGFGSDNYPEFCKYAILVNATLQTHEKYIPVLPLHTVNQQSKTEFNNWLNQWSSFYNLQLIIDEGLLKDTSKKESFKVVEKSDLNVDNTFTIALKPLQKTKFTSGDLLEVIPENETVARLYSIAKIGDVIVLSVKKHKLGICSTWLHNLSVGDIFEASTQANNAFHLPKKSKEVLCIANGTGIAPFLGMMNDNLKTKKHLFLGVRNRASLSIYTPFLNKETLSTFELALSREGNEKKYVQDCVAQQEILIKNLLSKKGVILICGSLMMQKEVFLVLEKITQKHLKRSVKFYQQNNQIKTDCY